MTALASLLVAAQLQLAPSLSVGPAGTVLAADTCSTTVFVDINNPAAESGEGGRLSIQANNPDVDIQLFEASSTDCSSAATLIDDDSATAGFQKDLKAFQTRYIFRLKYGSPIGSTSFALLVTFTNSGGSQTQNVSIAAPNTSATVSFESEVSTLWPSECMKAGVVVIEPEGVASIELVPPSDASLFVSQGECEAGSTTTGSLPLSHSSELWIKASQLGALQVQGFGNGSTSNFDLWFRVEDPTPRILPLPDNARFACGAVSYFPFALGRDPFTVSYSGLPEGLDFSVDSTSGHATFFPKFDFENTEGQSYNFSVTVSNSEGQATRKLQLQVGECPQLAAETGCQASTGLSWLGLGGLILLATRKRKKPRSAF